MPKINFDATLVPPADFDDEQVLEQILAENHGIQPMPSGFGLDHTQQPPKLIEPEQMQALGFNSPTPGLEIVPASNAPERFSSPPLPIVEDMPLIEPEQPQVKENRPIKPLATLDRPTKARVPENPHPDSTIAKEIRLREEAEAARQTWRAAIDVRKELIREQDKIVRDLHDLFTAAKRRLKDFG